MMAGLLVSDLLRSDSLHTRLQDLYFSDKQFGPSATRLCLLPCATTLRALELHFRCYERHSRDMLSQAWKFYLPTLQKLSLRRAFIQVWVHMAFCKEKNDSEKVLAVLDDLDWSLVVRPMLESAALEEICVIVGVDCAMSMLMKYGLDQHLKTKIQLLIVTGRVEGYDIETQCLGCPIDISSSIITSMYMDHVTIALKLVRKMPGRPSADAK